MILTVLAVAVCLGGCFTRTVDVKNYEQAVAEYGRPSSCETKPDGYKYCDWVRDNVKEIDYSYRLYMVFNREGTLVKSYTRGVVQPNR